jgi:putative nucleotidyltransferase with HDIG domain
MHTGSANPPSEREHLDRLATALAKAVDAKDSYTRSHCQTVSQFCAAIAIELGHGPERVAKLRLAGLLHDVGKIGISDAILRKPSALTDEEFELMKAHTRLGYDIVRGAELAEEARWILYHHERLDGSGYPHGLRGDEVPLESRVILVSDAFEAMTAGRPYRAGCPERKAFEELDRHAGTQFDPLCVAALRRALPVALAA